MPSQTSFASPPTPSAEPIWIPWERLTASTACGDEACQTRQEVIVTRQISQFSQMNGLLVGNQICCAYGLDALFVLGLYWLVWNYADKFHSLRRCKNFKENTCALLGCKEWKDDEQHLIRNIKRDFEFVKLVVALWTLEFVWGDWIDV